MTLKLNVRVTDEIRADLGRRLQRVGVYMVGAIRRNLNRAEPYRRFVGQRGVYYRGLSPSLPGEYPKKITGQLQRAVSWEYRHEIPAVRIGVNLPYAKFLEFGTRVMKARPFISQTFSAEKTTLERILTG